MELISSRDAHKLPGNSDFVNDAEVIHSPYRCNGNVAMSCFQNDLDGFFGFFERDQIAAFLKIPLMPKSQCVFARQQMNSDRARGAQSIGGRTGRVVMFFYP